MAFAFEEATVVGLAHDLDAGRLTSVDLVRAYLARIEAVDPLLRSVIQVAPDPERVAAERDRERAARGARSPLHGLPILVKDNVDTAGELRTTAGSLALADARPRQDAAVVRRLHDSGAIVLGKANLSEWANFRSTRSTSGWSAAGGQCANPYALDRNPCGSSSGSAVAVAADLCAVAVGTETDGSIVCPSSVSGVVGIKPTIGLVSRSGIVPISHTQDTAGPIARSVADAAALLVALAAPDLDDPGSRAAPEGWDPLAGLAADDLKGLRIGVARSLAGFHASVDRVFAEALLALAALGAQLVDPVELPHVDELEAPELEVLLVEFKHDLDGYLAALDGDGPRSLADVIAFNAANADHELVYFGQELFEQAVEKGALTEPGYLEALETCGRLSREEGLDVALSTVDALVAPTSGPAWLTDHVNGDHYVGGNAGPAAISGYPNLTVPMGSVGGLPVGLSFMGPAWSEPLLVRCAAAFERETGHRRPATLVASITP
jgi:amidase